jgi:hypothetical protein
MSFTDSVKAAALKRSGGRCECARRDHPDHPGRRCATLVEDNSAAFFHRTTESSGGNDSLFNCEVLCLECYDQARLVVPPASPLDRAK